MTVGIDEIPFRPGQQGGRGQHPSPGSEAEAALRSLDAARARMLATPWGIDGCPSEEARRLLMAIADPDVFLAPILPDTHPGMRRQALAYVLEQALARHVVFETGRRASAGEALTVAESGFALGLVAGMRGSR